MKVNILIFSIIIFLGFIGAPSLSSSQYSPSVELAIFNFSYSWGHCYYDSGYHSDFYSPSFFTLGIANNGTKPVLLEGVNITIIELIQGCIESRSVIELNEEEGFPIRLYPRSYWLHNVTCPYTSTYKVKIQILVSGVLIDYGEVIYASIVLEKHQVWPSWSEYRYYKDVKTNSAIEGSGFLVSIFTLIVWTKIRDKTSNSFP